MDKSKENEVREIVENLIPDPDERKIALSMMAEGIREANLYGRDKWAVHILSDRCRLLVGHLIVFTIHQDRIWLSCDKDLLASKHLDFGSMSSWEWDESVYPNYKQIPAHNGFYTPNEAEHPIIWPELRRLFFEAIYKAAHTTMDPRTPSGHSPGTLQYIRNELEEHIPDPLY